MEALPFRISVIAGAARGCVNTPGRVVPIPYLSRNRNVNIIQHPVSGVVAVGTVTGDLLYSFPYSVPHTDPVGPVMLQAFSAIWDAIPDVLSVNGAGRFDLLVRQSTGGGEAIPTYWQSGLSAGALCGLVARRLRSLRAAVDTPRRPHSSGVTVTEVADDGTVQWVPPARIDHAEQVREQLSAIVWAEYRDDPWSGSRR